MTDRRNTKAFVDEMNAPYGGFTEKRAEPTPMPTHAPPRYLVRQAVDPIERDETMDRTYIPLPGGWRIQTTGPCSAFCIQGPGGDRLAIPDIPYLHATLERMARDIHAASQLRFSVADTTLDATSQAKKLAETALGTFVDVYAHAGAVRKADIYKDVADALAVEPPENGDADG
jgi:hypothetical protein